MLTSTAAVAFALTFFFVGFGGVIALRRSSASCCAVFCWAAAVVTGFELPAGRGSGVGSGGELHASGARAHVKRANERAEVRYVR